jgi:putative restriction endonuclease
MDYLHKLTHLRLNTNRNQWSAATANRAPHKPFLLLSILDLAAQGQIDSPFIKPSFDLIERFARYWDLVRPPSGKCNMAYPSNHMRSEGFWRLVSKLSQEINLRGENNFLHDPAAKCDPGSRDRPGAF